MPTLTSREKRTVRTAAVAVAIYLMLFYGFRGWKYLEAKRNEYQQLVIRAERLKRELLPYENKALLLESLERHFRMDPEKLAKASVVAEASSAIQKAAKTGGVQIGPIRESAARPSAKELASMQIEGSGPIAAVMTLLHRMESLGYPLVIDSVQLSPEASKPGVVKLNLTIVILDFDQWKTQEPPHA